MNIYLDNAATTPIDPEVLEAMRPYFETNFGNPSSTHSHGRKVKAAIEYSRKQVADLLNVTPGEVFFTSGGTEADNTLICSSVESYGIKNIITSKVEHHAVLHTAENLEKIGKVGLHYVNLDVHGSPDYEHLEQLLKENPNSLVCLMHANNEIGNLTDLQRVGELCKEHGGLFQSDTVQTMGHYKHDLTALPVQYVTGAAHKFHGPKGIGFMYIERGNKINPLIHGGAQERSMRGGTENVYGIIGLTKALEIAYRDMDEHQKYIQSLKDRMISKFKAALPEVHFNGASSIANESLYTVLNVCLPATTSGDMLLFNLDISGISASGGSACSSGAAKGSHVLEAIGHDSARPSVRFSFSKFNKPEEIDYTVEKIADFYKEVTV